jgi:hypothetical protein
MTEALEDLGEGWSSVLLRNDYVRSIEYERGGVIWLATMIFMAYTKRIQKEGVA